MEQQSKKKSNWALPWIITGALIIILLGYLWWLKGRDAEPIRTATTDTTTSSPRAGNSTVADYVRFIDSGGHQMNLEHEFTSKALHKLADATSAMARAAGQTPSPALDSVHVYANNITEDKYATSHADDIRRGANIIVAALQSLQRERYPALGAEARDIATAAFQINPDKLALDQREEVKGFFRSTASLLQKMN